MRFLSRMPHPACFEEMVTREGKEQGRAMEGQSGIVLPHLLVHLATSPTLDVQGRQQQEAGSMCTEAWTTNCVGLKEGTSHCGFSMCLDARPFLTDFPFPFLSSRVPLVFISQGGGPFLLLLRLVFWRMPQHIKSHRIRGWYPKNVPAQSHRSSCECSEGEGRPVQYPTQAGSRLQPPWGQGKNIPSPWGRRQPPSGAAQICPSCLVALVQAVAADQIRAVQPWGRGLDAA